MCKAFAPPSVARFHEWMTTSATRFRLELGARTVEWPQFAEGVWYFPGGEPALTAWDRVIWTLRDFRQGQNFGRNPGSPRPGRSRFPEPESIRRLASDTNRQVSGHQRLSQIPDDAFPRAEFGLPIVFHFQGKGEPATSILYPIVGEGREQRMGSPLLLRPVGTAEGKAVAMAVRLRAPALTEVELTGDSISQPALFPAMAIHRPDLASYPNSPLAGSSDGSALEAFLAFAQNADNKFRRVLP